jgi:arylsulfatase
VRFTVNLFSEPYTAAAADPLTAGSHELEVRYTREQAAGGPIIVSIDGAEAGSVALPADMPFRWQIGGAGLLVGRDSGFPVDDSYRPPFPFTGGFDEIVIEIPFLAPPPDPEAEVEQLLKHE